MKKLENKFRDLDTWKFGILLQRRNKYFFFLLFCVKGMFYTKEERMQIVMDTVKSMKQFRSKNGKIVDLYNENMFYFVKDLKKIFNDYVKQDDSLGNIVEFAGTLDFAEVSKIVEYKFPADRNVEPVFMIRD